MFHRASLTRGRALAVALGTLTTLAITGPAHAGMVHQEGDTLVFRANPGERNVVMLYPGRGTDQVQITDTGTTIGTDAPSCWRSDPNTIECAKPPLIRVELGDADDRNDFATTFPSSVRVELLGQDGDDRLETNEFRANAVTLDGGAGNDRLEGHQHADVLLGGPGHDLLEAGAGDDQLQGGDGDDSLRPDAGTSVLDRDVVDGGAGIDVVRGWQDSSASTHPRVSVTLDDVANDGRPGEGDLVTATEIFYSGVSGDWVLSDAGEDVVVDAYLDEQASTIAAGGGRDGIKGGNYRETIDGGSGDDVLEGGYGDDVITGGPGRDAIHGDDTDPQCGGNGQSCITPFGNDEIHARDGEVDSIDCGVGTDRAVVDADDVVSNCETVELPTPQTKAPGEPTPSTPPNPPGAGDPNPGASEKPTSRVRIEVPRTKLRTALRRGLKLRLTGVKRGRHAVVAKVAGRTVARTRVRVGASGRATATLRFRSAVRRSLARRRSVRLTITVAGVRTHVVVKR